MEQKPVHLENPWVPGGTGYKTNAQKFFEAYARNVDGRSFADHPMTKWYGDKSVYRSETGKVYRGPDEMLAWMKGIFFSFEKVEHILEHYLEIPNEDGTVMVHMSFRRRLWLKGNTSEEPDTDTPTAWMCNIGPAIGGEGYLGLQFYDCNLYWDKTKTVELLGKVLPSDSA